MSFLTMAWRDLARRRLRTGLTVAGIAVGVALILFLLSLVAGINVQVRASVRGLGGADITVNNSTVTGERQTFLFGSTATLNESLVGNIASLPDVYSVSPESLEVVYANGALAPIWGIDPSTYDKTSGALNLISGREIATSDVNVADLGQGLAQFLNLTLGDNVTIQARSPHETNSAPLMVVGIYETGQTLIDRGLYVERDTITNLTNSTGTVTSILVKVNDPNNVGFVSNEISGLFPGTRVVTASSLVSSASQRARVWTLLDMVGMRDRAFHRPDELSGGEQQRIGIARALANNPSLVLADEPTGDLDSENANTFMQLVKKLNQTYSQTFLIVTHDTIVSQQCDTIYHIRDGKINKQA